MSGTVGGVTVFGTNSKRPDPKPDSSGSSQSSAPSKWDGFFNMSFKDIIGLALGVITAYMFYKMTKNHGDGKEAKATEDAAKKPGADDKSVDEARDSAKKDYAEDVRNVPRTNPKVPQALKNGADQMSDGLRKVTDQKVKDVLQDKVDAEVDRLSDVLESQAPSDTIEDVASSLSDAQTALESGDLATAKSKLTEVRTKIEAARSEGTWEQYEKDALEQTERNVKEAQEQTDAIEEAAKKKAAEKDEPADEQDTEDDDLETEPEGD
jgi:hypothetical protein